MNGIDQCIAVSLPRLLTAAIISWESKHCFIPSPWVVLLVCRTDTATVLLSLGIFVDIKGKVTLASNYELVQPILLANSSRKLDNPFDHKPLQSYGLMFGSKYPLSEVLESQVSSLGKADAWHQQAPRTSFLTYT